MTRAAPAQPRRRHRVPWIAVVAIVGAAIVASPRPPDRRAAGADSAPGFDSPGEAMEWVLLAHRDERGNIPRDGMARARAQADAMRRASQGEALRLAESGRTDAAGISRGAWTWLGPTNVGGRVRALVVHPTMPSVLIAGGVAGGIWKSTDGGSSWRAIDDFMANLAVSCMVYRPGEPNRLFAGTGEGFFNADSIRGAGIFTSADEGESWTQLSSTANVNFDFVNRLAFSSDGSTLLAATRTGLFRSTDLGGSWAQVSGQSNVMDVKFIAGSSALAVASGRNRNAYFSANGGQTWTLSSGLTTSGASLRVELAVSASAPNVAYASLDETTGQIWKSTDHGASYVKVSDSRHLSSQGWYDNALWVDPTNPDHVIAGGVSLFRSTNGGANFSGVSGCHVDQHAIVHDPGYNGGSNRRVYFASDGGVCKMDDVTINSVTSLRNGLGITQFYAGGAHAASGRLMGGTQDNGTLTYTLSAGSNAWSTQFGSDGGFSAIDPTDANILYGETQNFRIHRSLTGGTPSQFIYGGTGSTSCNKPVPFQITDACNGTANFIAPFMLDPNEPNRLLAGGRSLWRSNDPRAVNTPVGGPSWRAIKGPTPGNSNISAIAVAQGNPDIIWVGHNNGDVYVTLNGTADAPIWTEVGGAIPNRVVTSLAIDSGDPRIVYAALGGFSPDSLWRTANGGATWQDATGSGATGLPDAPIRSIVFHPHVREWLFAASDVGVFASEDAGATWSLPHDGPANVAVFQLMWMDSTLVAVTHGRGFFSTSAVSAFPGFARRPRSQAVLPGHSVAFNVVAVGAPPLEYQWYRGQSGDTSNPIPGATSGAFTTPPITETTSFWVRVTGPLGVVNSNTATLTLVGWSTLLPGVTNQNAEPVSGGASGGTSSLSSGSGLASGQPATGASMAGATANIASAPGVPGPTSSVRAPIAWLSPPVDAPGPAPTAIDTPAATSIRGIRGTVVSTTLPATRSGQAAPAIVLSTSGLPGVAVAGSPIDHAPMTTTATAMARVPATIASHTARRHEPAGVQFAGEIPVPAPTQGERGSPGPAPSAEPASALAEPAAVTSETSVAADAGDQAQSDWLPIVLIVFGLALPAVLARALLGRARS